MVQSGLAGRTEVSHFRLSAHLMLALFTFGGLIWTALDLKNLARDPASAIPLPASARFAALMLGAPGTAGHAWRVGRGSSRGSGRQQLAVDERPFLVPDGIDWSNGAACSR